MKFDRPGIIGFHAGGAKTDSFARLTKIKKTGEGSYDVHFMKSDGHRDFWCISTKYNDTSDFIEIDDIRYVGDKLKEFCEVFIQMYETEKAIDSL